MRSFSIPVASLWRPILSNAVSLVGTYAVTSGLGFLYWWLAARCFPPESVGEASAAISAMLLLGTLGSLGLGTLLITELPRRNWQAGSLLITALLAAGVAGIGLGLLFAGVPPWIATGLRPLFANPWFSVLFAVGAGLTAASLVLDQALLGLLRGGLQLQRNGLFSLAKLVLLLVAAFWLPYRNSMVILTAWALGNFVSLAALPACPGAPRYRLSTCRPRWRLLKRMSRPALWHQALNLASQAPGLALPVLVTALLSAQANAYFYAAWMVYTFAALGPSALATSLYAAGSAVPGALVPRLRLTLRLSLLIALLAEVVLLVGANPLLSLFSRAYATQAAGCLRLLGLAVFPLVVKTHYVALKRLSGKILPAAGAIFACALLELSLSGLGAHLAGLPGVGLGWLAALCLEALALGRVVHRAAVVENECL